MNRNFNKIIINLHAYTNYNVCFFNLTDYTCIFGDILNTCTNYIPYTDYQRREDILTMYHKDNKSCFVSQTDIKFIISPNYNWYEDFMEIIHLSDQILKDTNSLVGTVSVSAEFDYEDTVTNDSRLFDYRCVQKKSNLIGKSYNISKNRVYIYDSDCGNDFFTDRTATAKDTVTLFTENSGKLGGEVSCFLKIFADRLIQEKDIPFGDFYE